MSTDSIASISRAVAEDVTGETDDDLALESLTFTEWIRGGSACFISMAFHILLLVTLAVIRFKDSIQAEVQTIVSSPMVERVEDEPVEIELNQEVDHSEMSNVGPDRSAPVVAGVDNGTGGMVGIPTLDPRVVSEADLATKIVIETPTVSMPSAIQLIQSVPDGDVKGEPRAVVGDYKEALDRITQEIVWMLEKGPVLAVWLFDESESMKDDQQEILDRVHNVYRQLGIYGRADSDALLTSVVSYGANYRVHTERPTGNGDEIKQAIDNIAIDASGKEMMCQAVGKAILDFRKHATRGRQMALILVTDESGERENNDRFLEAAIAEARLANCRVFVLGREAVFGYPYAWIRWRHPKTHRTHWLPIDRGPETGFPEQLQTDGLRRRQDAFSSGFGPYEQSRLARETNGVFFMLPSVESNLVGAQKQRYAVESMRPFRPDLRARGEILSDRSEFPLRALIWKVISDLNPWNSQSGKNVELLVEFSTNPQEMAQQIRTNQQKAVQLLRYLAEAQNVMEQGSKLREQEADPRWQANYDLIYSQIVSYQARIYEYGAGLEPYLSKPPIAPMAKPPNLQLANWDVATRNETVTRDSKPVIEQATKLFQGIAEKFPGTPWAARAQWELQRGFGVHLVPDYHEMIIKDPTALPPPNL